MNQPDPDLLQALEHMVEQVRRVSVVAQQLIDAIQQGERPSDSVLADYTAQLRTADGDTRRIEELIAMLWQIHGKHRAQ